MKGLILTYLLTYGGAAVAVFNPFYGLLVYIAFAVARPDWIWHWVSLPAHQSRIVATAMLVGWIGSGFGELRLGRAKAVTLAFVGYWLWCVISAGAVAENTERALWYIETLAKILLPFLVGITVIDSVEKLKMLVWTIVVTMGYVALELNNTYYGGYNRLYFEGFGSMDNNSFSIALVTATGFAVFLALDVPRWWQKSIAAMCALLMMNAIFFSFSRGGMLALSIMGLVAFFLVPKRPMHYLMFLGVLLVGYRLAGQEVVERFMSTFVDEAQRDTSSQSRLDMWADCWDVMLRYPIFGVGPENWGDIAPQYGWPRGKYAHSLWMQTGAEVGFIGLAHLLAFYGLCVLGMWPLARGRYDQVDPELAVIGRMVIASLVGFMIAAQFVSLWGLELPYYIVLVGACALKLSGNPPRQQSFMYYVTAPQMPHSPLTPYGRPAAREL